MMGNFITIISMIYLGFPIAAIYEHIGFLKKSMDAVKLDEDVEISVLHDLRMSVVAIASIAIHTLLDTH